MGLNLLRKKTTLKMMKLAIFAAILATAYACDYTALAACTVPTGTSDYCSLYGNYMSCISDAGCMSDTYSSACEATLSALSCPSGSCSGGGGGGGGGGGAAGVTLPSFALMGLSMVAAR